MHKKLFLGVFFQVFVLFSAESETFLFSETSSVAPLKEEWLFYESQLGKKALKTQCERPFDEEHQEKAITLLQSALKRFDDFRTNDFTGHCLMRVEKNTRIVALIVFGFDKEHQEKPVWVGPLVISADIDQKKLWLACKEEARKRGGLTFYPGLNKRAFERERPISDGSEELECDGVSPKEASAKVYARAVVKNALLTRQMSTRATPAPPPAMRVRTGSESSALLGGKKEVFPKKLLIPPPARSIQAFPIKLGSSVIGSS